MSLVQVQGRVGIGQFNLDFTRCQVIFLSPQINYLLLYEKDVLKLNINSSTLLCNDVASRLLVFRILKVIAHP